MFENTQISIPKEILLTLRENSDDLVREVNYPQPKGSGLVTAQ